MSRILLWCVLLAAGLSLASAAQAQTRLAADAAAGAAAQAAHLAPDAAWAGPVEFVLDDGSLATIMGVETTTGDRTLAGLWLNRFNVGQPLTIDTISIFWYDGLGIEAGMEPRLVAYHDPQASGSPAGAQRLAGDEMVTIATLNAFQTYAVNFTVPGPGDVYIGFVDEWARVPSGLPEIIRPAAVSLA